MEQRFSGACEERSEVRLLAATTRLQAVSGNLGDPPNAMVGCPDPVYQRIRGNVIDAATLFRSAGYVHCHTAVPIIVFSPVSTVNNDRFEIRRRVEFRSSLCLPSTSRSLGN